MGFHLTTAFQPGDVGGACFFCKSAQRVIDGIPEPLFRTDVDYDGETALCADGHPITAFTNPGGNIVICASCAAELAGLVGHCSPADAEALVAGVDELRAELAAAVEQRESAEGLVAAIRRYDGAHDTAKESAPTMAASTGVHADGGNVAPVEPKKAAAAKKNAKDAPTT